MRTRMAQKLNFYRPQRFPPSACRLCWQGWNNCLGEIVAHLIKALSAGWKTNVILRQCPKIHSLLRSLDFRRASDISPLSGFWATRWDHLPSSDAVRELWVIWLDTAVSLTGGTGRSFKEFLVLMNLKNATYQPYHLIHCYVFRRKEGEQGNIQKMCRSEWEMKCKWTWFYFQHFFNRLTKVLFRMPTQGSWEKLGITNTLLSTQIYIVT